MSTVVLWGLAISVGITRQWFITEKDRYRIQCFSAATASYSERSLQHRSKLPSVCMKAPCKYNTYTLGNILMVPMMHSLHFELLAFYIQTSSPRLSLKVGTVLLWPVDTHTPPQWLRQQWDTDILWHRLYVTWNQRLRQTGSSASRQQTAFFGIIYCGVV